METGSTATASATTHSSPFLSSLTQVQGPRSGGLLGVEIREVRSLLKRHAGWTRFLGSLSLASGKPFLAQFFKSHYKLQTNVRYWLHCLENFG